jgi:hypothetical protein
MERGPREPPIGRWPISSESSPGLSVTKDTLPELEARHRRFGRGWWVGVSFIPVLNLWAPYQVMRDLAKASRNPPWSWQLEDTPVVIIDLAEHNVAVDHRGCRSFAEHDTWSGLHADGIRCRVHHDLRL